MQAGWQFVPPGQETISRLQRFGDQSGKKSNLCSLNVCFDRIKKMFCHSLHLKKLYQVEACTVKDAMVDFSGIDLPHGNHSKNPTTKTTQKSQRIQVSASQLGPCETGPAQIFSAGQTESFEGREVSTARMVPFDFFVAPSAGSSSPCWGSSSLLSMAVLSRTFSQSPKAI